MAGAVSMVSIHEGGKRQAETTVVHHMILKSQISSELDDFILTAPRASATAERV